MNLFFLPLWPRILSRLFFFDMGMFPLCRTAVRSSFFFQERERVGGRLTGFDGGQFFPHLPLFGRSPPHEDGFVEHLRAESAFSCQRHLFDPRRDSFSFPSPSLLRKHPSFALVGTFVGSGDGVLSCEFPLLASITMTLSLFDEDLFGQMVPMAFPPVSIAMSVFRLPSFWASFFEVSRFFLQTRENTFSPFPLSLAFFLKSEVFTPFFFLCLRENFALDDVLFLLRQTLLPVYLSGMRHPAHCPNLSLPARR